MKLDKVFAKPFLGSLDGHSDVVQCLLKHPTSLSTVVSAAADGEIKVWDLQYKRCLRTINAHDGIVRSLCAPRHGNYFFSVDNGANIKQWPLSSWTITDEVDDPNNVDRNTPINTIIGKSVVMSMDHHYSEPLIATSGENVQIWEETRSDPIRTFSWGHDSVNTVKFNPVETNLLATTASDRSITLYDIRKEKPLRKVVLGLRSNALAWNPMEAFNFTVANEDFE